MVRRKDPATATTSELTATDRRGQTLRVGDSALWPFVVEAITPVTLELTARGDQPMPFLDGMGRRVVLDPREVELVTLTHLSGGLAMPRLLDACKDLLSVIRDTKGDAIRFLGIASGEAEYRAIDAVWSAIALAEGRS